MTKYTKVELTEAIASVRKAQNTDAYQRHVWARLAKILEAERDELQVQIDRLANFIMDRIPGEPSQNQGAVDTAIRIMGQQRAAPEHYSPVVAPVIAMAEAHGKTWRNQPDAWEDLGDGWWLAGVVSEVGELAEALQGRHEHEPELELRQIASICLNWLDMRRQRGLGLTDEPPAQPESEI